MDSSTEIANTALGHLGNVNLIQDLDTDQSKEGKVISLFYTSLLKSLIGSKAWWWATQFQKLALQSFYPSPEWPFAYLYPAKCLRMVRLWNYLHTDTLENSIKYLKVNNGTQRIVVSEFGPVQILPSNRWKPTLPPSPLPADAWPVPVAQCVFYTDNVSLMPDMFKQAFAFILAAYAAPSLPGIGQVDLREKNLQLGNAALNQALADDQNESRQFVDMKSVIQKAGQGEGVPIHGLGFRSFNANTWPGGV